MAYLGADVSVGELMARGPYSLLSQSWAPRDMRNTGAVNADGYGAAWWVDGEPVRYRSAVPAWTDSSGSTVLSAIRSRAALIALRSATVGMPVVSTANAPFTDGRWAFSHNGMVPGWPEALVPLAGELPTTDLLTLDAPTDSALLWAWLRARLQAGMEPAEVVGELVRRVGRAAPGSRLNLLLTDGARIVATTWYHSLSYLVTGDAVVVASEPYDEDPRWQPVPDHSLLTAADGNVAVSPLDPPFA